MNRQRSAFRPSRHPPMKPRIATLTPNCGGKEWESNPPGTSRGPSLDLKSRRPAGVRISSVRRAREHVSVADAPGEFYPIEVLEHLDGEVAADARAVAERGGGDAAFFLRLGTGKLLEPADPLREKEAVLRNAYRQSEPRGTRQRRLELFRVDVQGTGQFRDRRRAKRALLQERLDSFPQSAIG